MLGVPRTGRSYEAPLAQQNVMAGQRPRYQPWLRYYLDFCGKYSFAPTERQKFARFSGKIARQASAGRCQQTGRAVVLHWEALSRFSASSRRNTSSSLKSAGQP